MGQDLGRSLPSGRILTSSLMSPCPSSIWCSPSCIGGEIDELNNKRAWIMIMPIPFMEVEAAWAGLWP